MTNYYFEIKSKYIIKNNRAENPTLISGEKGASTCIFALEDGMLKNVDGNLTYSILVSNSNKITRKYSVAYEEQQNGKVYLVWNVNGDTAQNVGDIDIQLEIAGNGYLWKSNICQIHVSGSLKQSAEEIPPESMEDYYTKVQTDEKFEQLNTNIGENYYTKSQTDTKLTEALNEYSTKEEIEQKADLAQVYTKEQLYTREDLYNKDELYSKDELYNKNQIYNKDEVYNKEQVNNLLDGATIPENGVSVDVYTKDETNHILENYATVQSVEQLDTNVKILEDDVVEIKQDSIDAFSLIGALSDGLATDYYTSQTIDQMLDEISPEIDTSELATKSDLDEYALSQNVYDKLSVDLKLNAKSDISSTYTKAEVDSLIKESSSPAQGGTTYMVTSSTGGPKAALTNTTNLNSISDTGMYSYTGSVSAPTSNPGILFVMSIPGFTLQFAFDIMCKRFMRGCAGGMWSPWA